MDDRNAPVPMAALLAHEGWVRGLARSLVSDESRADDVVQETWLTALREPPREGGSIRSWLGSVVRSRVVDAARADGRRARRERIASRDEPVESAADAAAATETHRMLVRAVMALDEPYRSSVILRYFEGLPPREVGARTGVPAETARTRVKRGVETLRARLDEEHGGDRRRWTAMVLPLAGLGRAAGDGGRNGARGAPGAAAMATGTKIGIAACAALALLAGIWWLTRDGEPAEVASAPEPAPAETARESSRDRAQRPAAAAADAGVAPAAPPAPSAEPEAPATGARVRLRFVDENGVPLTAEQVKERWGVVAAPRVRLIDDRVLRGSDTDSRSRFFARSNAWLGLTGLDTDGDAVVLDRRIAAGRWRFVVFPGGAPTWISRPIVLRDGDELPLDVVLAPARFRRVRVVADESGAPLPGMNLVPEFELGDDMAFLEGAPVTSDDAGEARLPLDEGDRKAYRRPPTWWALGAGRATSFQLQAPDPARPDEPLVVKVRRTATVEGEAYRADGSPAAGCVVRTGRKGYDSSVLVAADGRFSMASVPVNGPSIDLRLEEDLAAGVVRMARFAVAPDGATHVRFGDPAASSGRLTVVLTVAGRPLPGRIVAVVIPRPHDTGSLVPTDAEGVAAVTGLPTTDALPVIVMLGDLRVTDDFLAEPIATTPLVPGEERRLTLDLPPGVVRVRVVDAATGAGIPAAPVHVRPQSREAAVIDGWKVSLGDGTFTDEDGVALLVGLPPSASCEASAMDDATGLQGKGTVTSGTIDAPGEVTITLGK